MRGSKLYGISRFHTAALCLVVAVLALASVSACSRKNNDAKAQVTPSPEPVQIDFDPVETAAPSPSYSLVPESPRAEQPPNQPPPKKKVPAATGYTGPKPTNPAEAVAAAATIGRARGMRVAAAVLDRRTGKFYGAGDIDYAFASASVVKAFIAARLLADGKNSDPAISGQMWRMIVASDDKAATALYPLAGREGVVAWIANRYHLSGLSPATVPNYWGLTRITARAMVNFYAAVANDPVVGPWLMDAMAHAQSAAADGFPQLFGIPAVAHSWRVKQGWMCCLEGVTRMHSTGFVDGDRYTVALLTEGATSNYGSLGAQTVTFMAQALLPGGSIPQGAPEPPAPPAPPPTKPTPTPTPTPTKTTPPPTDPSTRPASG